MRYSVFVKQYTNPALGGLHVETFTSHVDAKVYADMRNRMQPGLFYIVPVGR